VLEGWGGSFQQKTYQEMLGALPHQSLHHRDHFYTFSETEKNTSSTYEIYRLKKFPAIF